MKEDRKIESFLVLECFKLVVSMLSPLSRVYLCDTNICQSL